MIKAYVVSIVNDPDQGAELVFAETASKAKNLVRDLDPDSYTDLRAIRYPEFDGMETATFRELALAKWKAGWTHDSTDEPVVDKDTEADFLAWFDTEGFEDEHQTWLECLKGTHTNN